MALNAGEVFFQAHLKVTEAEKQAKAFQNKVRKIYLDAQFKNLDPNKLARQAAQAAKVASQSAKIQAQVELNQQRVRKKVAQAMAASQDASRIEAKLEVNATKFKNSISSLSVATGNTLSAGLTKAADVGLQAVNKAFSATGGAVLESISSFEKIEGTLNQIAVKSSLTGEQFDNLKEKIRQVSATSVTTPQQLTGLANVLSTAGFAAESIEKLLKPLGVAEIALKRSADNLASDVAIIKDAFTLNVDQQSQISNFIASAVTAGNLDANTLATSTRYFRSQLQGLEGLQATNESILLASLAGFRGSTAGTGLQQVFAQGLKKQEEVSERLGVSLTDAAGNIRNESEVLREIAASLARIREQQGSGVASALGTELFGVRGNRIVSGLSKVTEDSINTALEKARRAVEGVDVIGQLADKTLEGVSGSLTRIGSQVDSFRFTLGDTLSTGVAGLLTGFSKIFEVIVSNQNLFDEITSAGERFSQALQSDRVVESLTQVGEILNTALQGVLDAIASQVVMIAEYLEANPEILVDIADKALQIGNAFVEVGRIVTASFGVLMNVLNSFFEGFAAGFGSAKADSNGLISLIESLGNAIGFLARPIGMIAGLLTNLLANLTSVFSSLSGGISFGIESEASPFSGITVAFDSLLNTITEVITKTEFFAQLGQQLKTVFDGVVSGIQSFVTSFLTNAAPGIQQFIEGIQAALPGISALVQLIVGWMVDATPIFQSLMTLTGTVLGNAVSLAGTLLGNLITITGTVAQIIADSGALDLVVKGLQGTVKFILDTLTLTSNVITSIQGFLYNSILPAINSIIQVIGTASNIITAGWLAPFQAVYDLIFQTNTLADNFIIKTLGKFAPQIEQLESFATEQWNSFTAGISNWFGDNLLPIFTNTIPAALSSFWVSELAKWENTKQLISDGLNGFLSFFTDTLPNAVSTAWANITSGFNNFISGINNFIGDSILSIFDAQIPAASTAMFAGINADLLLFGTSLLGFFDTNVINYLVNIIPNAIASTFAGITNSFTELTTTIGEWFTNSLLPFFSSTIPTSFGNLITDINNRILNLGATLSEWFNTNVVRYFSEVLPASFGAFLTGVYTRLEEVKAGVTSWLSNTLIPYFTDRLPVIFSEFVKSAIANFLQLTSRVTEFFAEVQLWVTSTVREYVASFVTFTLSQSEAVWNNIADKFAQATQLVTVTIPENVRTMIALATEQITIIWGFIQDKFNAVTQYLTVTLVDNFRGIISFGTEQATNLWNQILGLFNLAKDWITVQFIQYLTQLRQFAIDKVNEVVARATSFYEQIKEWLTVAIPGYVNSLIQLAKDKIQEVWDRVTELFNSVQEFVTVTLVGYLNSLRDKAVEIVNGIISKVQEFFAQVQTFIQETIPGYVNNLFSSITGQITSLGTTIVDTVKKPINDIGQVFTNITESSKSIGSNIAGWAGNVRGFIGEFGSNVWNNLLGAFGGGTPGQGNSSDLLAFLGGDLTAQEFLTRNSFGSSGGQQEALRLAQKYYSDPVTGSNENIFKQAGFSDALLRIVKSAEGFYENAYFDPNLYGGRGGYSIGFGTYARNSTERIGVEEGNRRLLDELESARKQVLERADRYGYKLNSSQVDAMISFVYNGGIGMFDQLSNYGKRSLDEISDKIPLYNKSGSRELLGLTRRREIEKTLFDGTTVNTIVNQVGNGLYDSYLTGLIPGQKYGASRSGGLRRHAGTDFDIQDRGGTFESFIGGRVVRTGYDAGGYYRWFDIQNDALGMIERIAELDNVYVKKGDIVQPGQIVGDSSTDTGVVHVEYRPIQGYNQNPFGYSGTIDPIDYLVETLGLFTLNGTKFTPVGGSATSFSGDRGQFGGASDTLARLGGDLVQVADSQMLASEQISSFAQQITDALYSTTTSQGATTTQIASSIDTSSPATQIAEALVGGDSTSTSADNIFAQLLAIAQRIESDLRIITQFFETLNTLTENIEDFVANIRNTVRSKIRIGLSPNDQENFSLINTLQQTYRTGRDQLRELTRSDSGEQSGLGRLVGLLTGRNTEEGAFNFGLPGAVSNLAESARNIYRTVADNYQSATEKIDLGKIGDVYDLLMRGQGQVKLDMSQFDLRDLTSSTFQQQYNNQALEQLSEQMVSSLLGIENTRLSAEAQMIKQFAEQSGVPTEGLDFSASGVEDILEEIAQQSGRDFNEILNDLKNKVGEAELSSSQATQQQLTDSQQQMVRVVELQAKLAEALLSEEYQAITEARKALLVDEQSRSKLFEDSLRNSLSQLSLAQAGSIDTPETQISDAIQKVFADYMRSQTIDLSQGTAVNEALRYFTNTANVVSEPSSLTGTSRPSSTNTGTGGSVTFKIQYEPVPGSDKGYVTTNQLDELVNYLNNEFSIDLSNQTLEKLRRNPSLRSYILDA